ncbi:amino acid ABC transporter substrate-binding protein [Siccirubricoccus sp. KC 17139]|uniref:Amino acid ABC transporter substrate-binding protein n=1 Tax=Siccirubricoccus soli TaxID=2899147 RepID=A0ABT1DB62_9PROT|nr:amino acid ABC transporter substrate-binding protein [Siccirubricoccus soli]MCO6419187.1 amino acid ABC transporter substrate-binding protein [Siccirubricoccus soli]MCP2685322.1 amino acid ABC transporter substrate-binding protein [Siccirubricoccus soli]
MRLSFALALALLLPWMAAAQPQAAGPTLAAVKARDILVCGTSTGAAGFSLPDSRGEYRGLDNDLCRAVAAAVLGDPAKIRWVPLTTQARFPALQSGQIDLLIRTATWTQSRDTANGLNFTAVSFYDGQGFLVRTALGVKAATELAGASICVVAGSTNELNLADWARQNRVEYRPVVFEQNDEARRSYLAGRCDAYSTDASQLAGLRASFPHPEEHVVLPEIISKEPHAPVVRQGDDQWFDIVRWTFFALLIAEENGITQANVDEYLNSQNPEVRRLLGLSGDHGPVMGLERRWAYWAIKGVGNYGEVFERNLGQGSSIKLPRGLNALWTRGGLMYAPPIR